jgi:hypothetical protein
MMVRYCILHRHAWAVSDPWKPTDLCPLAQLRKLDPPAGCSVRSVDAIQQINNLGRDVESLEAAAGVTAVEAGASST